MQAFKGDAEELRFYNSGKPVADALGLQRDLFFDEGYSCMVLGDLLFESQRTPLANAIPQAIFRESFPEIYDAFVSCGIFESYLTVFRKIFGDDVEVEFTVPAPGKLLIDIVAAGVELSDFVARSIVSNAYVFDEVVDEEDDNIVFQTIKGFTSEYELEQMLFEMVPAGIYTEITLDLGV